MMAGGMAKAHRVTSQRRARASIRLNYRANGGGGKSRLQEATGPASYSGASPPAATTLPMLVLLRPQGLAGIARAWSDRPNVRSGSKAEIAVPSIDVRFTPPASGHGPSHQACPAWARSRHRSARVSKSSTGGLPSSQGSLYVPVIFVLDTPSPSAGERCDRRTDSQPPVMPAYLPVPLIRVVRLTTLSASDETFSSLL